MSRRARNGNHANCLKQRGELPSEFDVWVFGSRVNGNARKYSDLDIVLITTEPLPFSIKADLVECFLESDLSFKVDIVDWSSTSEAFREIIAIEKVVFGGTK